MRNEGMLQEFKELVSIDAISGQESGIAAALRPKLEELGFTVTMDSAAEKIGGDCGNLIAVRDGELDGALLLSSHMDRMPNGFGIKPVERDGVLYSDGTTILAADDISGICGILDGLRTVIGSGKPLPRLEVVFTVQEETLFGSKEADYSLLQSTMGYIFDSTGAAGRFVIGAPGGYSLNVDITGKAAHAGNAPEKGINAAKVMCDIVSSLPQGRIDFETTANYPILHTDTTARNAVCDRAHIKGEARSRNPQKLTDYVALFRERCEAAAGSSGAEVVYETIEDYPAFVVTEDHPLLVMARAACAELELPYLAEVGGGAMDANIFAGHGITAVGVATGCYKNHSCDEYLVLEDFFRSGRLCACLIETYADTCSAK